MVIKFGDGKTPISKLEGIEIHRVAPLEVQDKNNAIVIGKLNETIETVNKLMRILSGGLMR